MTGTPLRLLKFPASIQHRNHVASVTITLERDIAAAVIAHYAPQFTETQRRHLALSVLALAKGDENITGPDRDIWECGSTWKQIESRLSESVRRMMPAPARTTHRSPSHETNYARLRALNPQCAAVIDKLVDDMLEDLDKDGGAA